MAAFQIPLSGAPETFQIALAGTSYTFTLQWRDLPTGGWVLDIGDVANHPIVSGIALTTSSDLLGQYDYLGFGGALYLIDTAGGDAAPAFDNLGRDVIMVFVTS